MDEWTEGHREAFVFCLCACLGLGRAVTVGCSGLNEHIHLEPDSTAAVDHKNSLLAAGRKVKRGNVTE